MEHHATYRNKTHRHSGRVCQGRFYAAVLRHAHFATALGCVEVNPVRARLVKELAPAAERWKMKPLGIAAKESRSAKATPGSRG